MLNLRTIKRDARDGFTLLEVLLVVAIIAILAGIVILAINPNKQLADSRNAQRSSDVTTILNAIYQYELDNNGTFPPVANGGVAVSSTATEICMDVTCATLVDLSALTTAGKYLVSVPKDPQCPSVCATHGGGYMVSRDVNLRITVNAPDAENKTITVTR